MMFEIYTKEVEIGGKTYSLKPLSGRYLPKLYNVMKTLDKGKDENGEKKEVTAQDLDEETMGKIHELALETFKKSYPQEDINKLDEWVTQNHLKLLEPLILVNFNNEELIKKDNA